MGRREEKKTKEVINAFPGYEYVRLKDGKFHNMYRGTDVGRGGYVYAEPGIYYNVALLDVQNMHGRSIELLNKFGKNTKRFSEIRQARNAIKTGDFDTARRLLDGKLAPYLNTKENAEQLSNALKLICNSTYGIAAASFDNPLRDPRDVNNIIALRGALFMRTLQDAIIEQGFRGIQYKTDSVKIPGATSEIIQFVMDFGKQYGYTFEHEATYDRICLVNESVYIAKYDEKGVRNKGGRHAGEWTATGAEFQHPYIFKTLFSGEPVVFSDYCETKSTTGTGIFLDMNEGYPDVSSAEKEKTKREHNKLFSRDKQKLSDEWAQYSDGDLENYISQGHAYSFVGRVGQFVAVQKGAGGGIMYREKDGKYYAVTGTKGYRWLEAEVVEQNHMEHLLDMEYYNDLVKDAIASIRKWGSYEEFVGLKSSDTDGVPCGDNKRNDCVECPMYENDGCKSGYSAAVKEGGSNGLVSKSA